MVAGELTVATSAVNTSLTFVPAVGTTYVIVHAFVHNGWVLIGTVLSGDALITNTANMPAGLKFGIDNGSPLFIEGRAALKSSYSLMQLS